jgi:hypothetical protein
MQSRILKNTLALVTCVSRSRRYGSRSLMRSPALSHDILAFHARISGKQLPADTPPRRRGCEAAETRPQSISPYGGSNVFRPASRPV